MSATVDLKKDIFGQIAALKTVNDGLPKLKLSSSFSSVNNSGNKTEFISDLLRSLVGYQEMTDSVVEILTKSIDKIEQELRHLINSDIINTATSCTDSTPPNWLVTNGIIIEVNKIDFFDNLRVEPNSTSGQLIYTDITPTFVDSLDFNTFLYGVIQNDGVTYQWPQNQPLYNITFNSQGTQTRPNNSLTIKLIESVATSKKLPQISTEYFNSIKMFDKKNVINQVMDINYGITSNNVGKSLKQLEKEQNINNVIQKIIDKKDDSTIPNSDFLNSNKEKLKQLEEAAKRKRGYGTLKMDTTITSSVPINEISNLNQQLSNPTITFSETKNIINNGLNTFSTFSALNVEKEIDKPTAKLDFIQKFINSLEKAIINLVITPKIIFPYVLNYKIINGELSDFDDPIDFLKKNKNLMQSMIKTISGIIVKLLMKKILKEISILVEKAALKRTAEKNKTRLSQMLSLVGVSQDSLRLIKEI
jgi:hypothetical protein